MTTAKKPTTKATYPRNEAKFIRITDDRGLGTIREGSVWTYWSPTSEREAAFGNEKFLAVSNKVRQDLNHVMLQGKFEVSAKNDFDPYVSRKEREADDKAIADYLRQKEEEEQKKTASQQQSQQSTTTKSSNKWASMNVPKPAAPQVVVAKGKAGKGGSRVRAEKKQKPVKEIKGVENFENLSEDETKKLFASAFLWREHTDRGMGKAFSSFKGDTVGLGDYLQEFIDFGITAKNIKDEAIPPFELLKKLQIMKDDPALLLYYERRLNLVREKGREDRVMFKDGKTFKKTAVPKSFQVAFGLAKGVVGAGKLAAKAPGAISEGIRSMSERASDITEKLDTGISKGAEWVKKRGSELAPVFKLSDEDKKINAAIAKQIGAGFKNLAAIMKERFPKKGAGEDLSMHAAENTSGIDKDITMPERTAGTPSTKEVSGAPPKEGGGLFGSLFKNFSKIFEFLKSPLKSLSKIFSGLLSVGTRLIGILGSVGGSLMRLVSSVGGTALRAGGSALASMAGSGAARGLLALGGSAAAVAGAGVAGYQIGSWLNEKYGLSDKISDALVSDPRKSQNTPEEQKMEDAQKQKMLAAGTPKDVVDKWSMHGSGGNLPKEYIEIMSKKREAAKAAAVQPAPGTSPSAQMTAQAATPPTVTPTPKQTSQQVTEAENQRAAVSEAKEDQKMKTMVNNSQNQSTNIMQPAAGPRSYPRTTNSTLQRFLDSRTVFTAG